MTAPDVAPAAEVVEVSGPVPGTGLVARLRQEVERHHVLVLTLLSRARRIEVLEVREAELVAENAHLRSLVAGSMKLLERVEPALSRAVAERNTARRVAVKLEGENAHLLAIIDRETRRLGDLIADVREINADDIAAANRPPMSKPSVAGASC